MRLAETTGGDLALDGGALLAQQIVAVEIGDDPSGRDRIHTHALEGELERKRLGHLDDAGLGHCISGRSLRCAEAEHRGDIDDRAALARNQHAARRLLCGEEDRIEVGSDHLPPLILRHIDGAARRRDASIVDQDRDRPERLLGRVEGARHGAAVEHVCPDGSSAAARLLDAGLDLSQPVGAARHQCDRGARVRQHLREAHAQPARRAGDERDLAFEIEQLGCGHMLHPCPVTLHKACAAGRSQAPARTRARPAPALGSARME